jgi:hypothetical protein
MSLTQRYLTKSVIVMCYSLGWVMEGHRNAWVTCAYHGRDFNQGSRGRHLLRIRILGSTPGVLTCRLGFTVLCPAACYASASTVSSQKRRTFSFNILFLSFSLFVSFFFFLYFYFCHPSVICKCYISFIASFSVHLSCFYFILHIFCLVPFVVVVVVVVIFCCLSILFLNRFYSPSYLTIFIS